MTSHRINFTKAALAKAPPADKGKRDYYYDEREVNKFLSHWLKRKISSF